MRKLFATLSLALLIGLLAIGPAEAGARKTADALGNAVEKIEASSIEPSEKLRAAMNDAKELKTNYWAHSRREVYMQANDIFDVLVSETKGSEVTIVKPSWL